MPQLTVRQAAERVGISRQTMFRYIKEGRVSATLSHSGEKQIEISELLRAFGALQPETVTQNTTKDRPRQSHSDSTTPVSFTYQIELERLKAQLELKSAELALAKERIAELKMRESETLEEKSRLLTLIEQQSRLLTGPEPARGQVAEKKRSKTKTDATQKLTSSKSRATKAASTKKSK